MSIGMTASRLGPAIVSTTHDDASHPEVAGKYKQLLYIFVPVRRVTCPRLHSNQRGSVLPRIVAEQTPLEDSRSEILPRHLIRSRKQQTCKIQHYAGSLRRAPHRF